MREETFFGRVVPTLAISILLMTVTAYLPVWYPSILPTLANLYVFLGLAAVEFALIFVMFRLRYSFPQNLMVVFIFAFFTGLTTGPAFFLAHLTDPTIVPAALLMTGLSMILLSALQRATRMNIGHWGPRLFQLLIIAIVLTVVQLFVGFTLFQIAVDLFVIVLFCFLILYDMDNILNRLDDRDWVMAVVDLYLDFLNILIRLIRIMIKLKSDD